MLENTWKYFCMNSPVLTTFDQFWLVLTSLDWPLSLFVCLFRLYTFFQGGSLLLPTSLIVCLESHREKNSNLKSWYYVLIFWIDYNNGAISMVHVAQDAGFKSRAAKAFLLGYTNSQGMHSSVQWWNLLLRPIASIRDICDVRSVTCLKL